MIMCLVLVRVAGEVRRRGAPATSLALLPFDRGATLGRAWAVGKGARFKAPLRIGQRWLRRGRRARSPRLPPPLGEGWGGGHRGRATSMAPIPTFPQRGKECPAGHACGSGLI